MVTFVALSLLVAVLALAYLFAPLLRQRVAVGGVLVAASLVITAGLYLLVGTPEALDPSRRHAPRTLDEAIARLEQELRREPNQAEGWRLLAEAYRAQGRAPDAAQAWAQAVAAQPKDPDLLAQAAEARALAAPDRRFDAAALALLHRALEMDPTHQRAAWFLGVAQRQSGQPAEAAKTWEALLARVDSTTASALRTQIDAAREEAGLAPLEHASAGEGAGMTGVRVHVDVAPTLRDSLPPDTAVFVLARVPGGPPMPVAVERLTLADLPADVVLDDGDSLMPTRRLSQVPRVEVLARASASGTANAASGDLESAPAEAALGGSVSLRIDRKRP